MASFVVIKTAKGNIEWSVSNQKIGLLMQFLDEIGFRDGKEPDKCPNCGTPPYHGKILMVDKGICPYCGKRLGLHKIEPMEKKESAPCHNCEEFYFGKVARLVRDCGQINCADCGKWLSSV